MRLEPARRAAPSPLLAAPLLLAVAAACAFPASADPEPGGVAIALTAADVDGRPHRLHGDFSFASVDGGVVRSVSTRSGGPHRGARASGDDPDVLEVQLPPGRYALSLDADFVVEDLGPCQRTATASRPAWVNPVHPPLVDVAAEQVTRVHFELASANGWAAPVPAPVPARAPPRRRAARSRPSRDPASPRRVRPLTDQGTIAMSARNPELSSWFTHSRRRMLGGLLLGAGTVLSACKAEALSRRATYRGQVLLGRMRELPPGLEAAVRFPLVEALLGRRARRFPLGATIPDGPLAYTSEHAPLPLGELEQMLVLCATAGNTGWINLHPHNPNYSPRIPNYAAAAGGRTFPSSAGFHTTEFFYTDDDGVYFFPTRDSGLLAQREEAGLDLQSYLEAHRARIQKLANGRLHIPANPAHIEMHNPWAVNRPGTTLIFPVADLAQHQLAALCYLVKNGACIFDDVNGNPIPGMERFASLVDVENPYPLSFVEQLSLGEVAAELSTACYAGMLMLQALGLGGWMFDGITATSVLGASGDPEVPGLGFQFQTDARWPLPNVTGLPGIFEGFCPPHYPNMRAAVEALVQRKFGPGGPFHRATPGPYRDNAKVRGAGEPHNEEFIECVSVMAQYVFDRFGKFPATIPSIYMLTYLQAHHLDLGFYDTHFAPGAYLETHRCHLHDWH